MFPYNQLRLAAALNHARNSPTGGPTSSSGPEAPPQTNSTSSPGSSGGPPGTGTPQTTGNPFASMPSPYGPLDPLIAFRSAGGCGFPPGAAPPGSRFMHEEPKPQQSYIGLIAMAILSTPDKKMVLSDIYQWILDNYNYFRTRGPGWRNSIRHNLSLNDCFVKAGRSANGKGHYWAIHPANMEDFLRGDFRRRRAQRKVRRHMGLSVGDDEDDSDDSPCGSPLAASLPFFGPGGKPPFGFPLGPFGPIGGGPLPFPLLQNPVAFASALGIPPMPPAGCPPLPGNLANLSALLAEQQHLMQSRNPPSNPNNPSSDTSALHDSTKATSSTSGGAPSQISPTDSSGSSESPTTSHSTSDGPQNLVMTPPQSEGGEHHRGAQKRARPCSSTGTFDVLSLLSAKRAKAADSETSTSDNETTTTTRNKLSPPGKIPGLVPVTSQQQAPGIGLWNPAAMALAGNPWSALLAATYANSFPLPSPVSGNSIVPSMNACTNNNTNTATRPTTANARTTSVLVAPTTTTTAATPVNANQSSPEPARQANNNSPNTALQWQETFAKIMARSYQGRQQAAEEKLKQQQQQAVALQASAHDK